MKIVNRTAWFVFAFFAIGVGLYPLSYYLVDMSGGIFGLKTAELLSSRIWNLSFYAHISFGGIALITGWSQFSRKLRSKRIKLHRNLGKIYVISVLLSGLAGLYIAFFATGGLVSQLGFGILAVFWLYTTVLAYQTIRKKMINDHRNWMMRSYALCLAAVTLRLWLPFFGIVLGIEFQQAYPIIAWLCWVPNLIIAELLIYRMVKKELISFEL